MRKLTRTINSQISTTVNMDETITSDQQDLLNETYDAGVVSIVTVEEEYELETEDIERILTEKYNLSKDTTFDWNIGQWVTLSIKTVKEE